MRMIMHPFKRSRSDPGRNALFCALLCFIAVQATVIYTYYNLISAKDHTRQQATEDISDGAIASSTGHLRDTPRVAQGAGQHSTAAKAASRARLGRRLVSRKEQAKLLLLSEHYDDRRVQRLRAQQQAAAARLAGGHPLFVTGTPVFPAGHEDGPCVGVGPPLPGAVAAVVVVTFNRARYLEQALSSLLDVHGRDPANRLKFPLFVSQDFDASGVQDVVEQHLDRLTYLQHLEVREPKLEDKKELLVYYRISNHYQFIFRTMFECFGFERVIILEDDMLLAPDIFSYFEATAPIYDRDATLLCVSSWNDHGQDRFVRNSTLLYRSDFFPGLGWMLNRRVWDSIREVWPRAYWDDFMRRDSTRQGRQCIRPEVCRTYNFGDIGSSAGQYFRLFLKPIKLNNEALNWQQFDLSYLEEDRYQLMFQSELAAAHLVTTMEGIMDAQPGPDYKFFYTSQQHYEKITGRLRMLREWRDGVPRGAYKGVVPVRNQKGARIFLAPSPDVDFQAPLVAPPGMVVRVDSTGALVRRWTRPPLRKAVV